MVTKVQEQLLIKNRILGVLLRDSRQAAGRQMAECAALLGIDESQYQAFEVGQAAPTLPQLEVLAYIFRVPISHFWGAETLVAQRPEDSIKDRVPEFLMLRQRIIGVRLRQLRQEAGLTLAQVAERTSFSYEQLEAVERGLLIPPVSELEILVRAVNGRLDDLTDAHGQIGTWLQSQEETDAFAELPLELRAFVVKPINRSYLELAMRLSQMEVSRLRTIAESILEITY